jgi:predicted DNA-binding protein
MMTLDSKITRYRLAKKSAELRGETFDKTINNFEDIQLPVQSKEDLRGGQPVLPCSRNANTDKK